MSEPYRLEFEISGLPKMSNQLLRGHWASKAGHAKEWKNKVRLACQMAIKPHKPLAHVVLELIRCSASEPDFDGLVSSFKHVIDALVEIGILAGDKSSNIGQPKYFWEKAQRNKGKIKVIVTER